VTGLFYGDGRQLIAQSIGVVTCVVFVFATFYAFFKLVDVLVGNRVSAEAELEGLDIPEMGVLGYPDFVLAPATDATPVSVAGKSPATQPILKPVRENG
jgi:ammonium transporter, Amt family